MSRRNPYLALEKRIAADERGGIVHRWEYGRKLLEAKAGRRQLPHGMLADLVAAAEHAGLKVSEREIQYRIRCAEVYASEAEVRTACADFGTWSALREAGFPPVELAESETDALEEVGLVEQDPLFEIPGFKPVLKIRGAKVDLAALTVRQAVDYRDSCREMHESFGRTVEHITESVEVMLRGAGGDLEANALDAYRRAGDAT